MNWAHLYDSTLDSSSPLPATLLLYWENFLHFFSFSLLKNKLFFFSLFFSLEIYAFFLFFFPFISSKISLFYVIFSSSCTPFLSFYYSNFPSQLSHLFWFPHLIFCQFSRTFIPNFLSFFIVSGSLYFSYFFFYSFFPSFLFFLFLFSSRFLSAEKTPAWFSSFLTYKTTTTKMKKK